MRARKNTPRRCFADGGKVDPEQLMRDMAAKYGGGAATKIAADPPPPPPVTEVAIVKPQEQKPGLLGKAVGILGGRKAEIDKVAGYANGGVVQPTAPYQAGSAQDPKASFTTAPTATAASTVPLPISQAAPVPQIAAVASSPSSGLQALRGYKGGGKIKGPGSPTSDSIDGMVRETQEPIKVSTDERILSAAQDQAMEGIAQNMGFESLDAMLEQTTGKPVGPTIKAGKRAAASGGTFADDPRDDLNNKPVTPTVGIAQMRENVAATQAAQAATPSAPMAAAPQAVQPGSPVSAPAEYNPVRTNNPFSMAPTPSSGQQGTKIDLPSLPYLSDEDVKGITAYNPAISQDPHTQAKIAGYLQSLPVLTPEQSILQKNPLALAKEQTIPKFISALVSNAPSPQSTPTGTVNVGSTAPGGTFKNGGNTYSVSATKQDGITKITSPGKAPAFTNVDAMQAVGQLNSVKPGAPVVTGIDLKGANESMARANAIRQSMIDGDGTGPKVAMIENSGLKETQALMDKWDMERLAKQNPQAAGIMRDYRAGIDRAAADVRHDQTVRRGQDLHASTSAAQLAGNPLDNTLKKASIVAAQNAIAKTQKQDDMLTQINAEPDPSKRRALMDSLLVSQGKNPAEHRYLKVEGGEEIGPDGFTKIKRPSGVYDTISGKFIPMTPDAAAPAQTGGKFVAGNTYTDAKGRKAVYQADGTWKEIG